MNNVNIIFLDVDGVLNSKAYFEQNKDRGHADINDCNLQMLAKIYHANSAKIVLSSSWRELDDESDIHVYWMYEYLVNELARYNMEIIDKTPVIGMNRPLEIKTWLDNRNDKSEICWISLDDDFPEEKYKECGIGGHLVQTIFFTNNIENGGLQEKHVELANRLFAEQGKNNEEANSTRI